MARGRSTFSAASLFFRVGGFRGSSLGLLRSGKGIGGGLGREGRCAGEVLQQELPVFLALRADEAQPQLKLTHGIKPCSDLFRVPDAPQ